jgi:hypothetical protein
LARVHLESAANPIRTDIEGQFTIDAPRSGVLVAAKPGFIRFEAPVTSLERPPEIRLIRASALAGRVVDDLGEPVVAAVVTASAPGLRPSSWLTATTNDRGEFRIGGLQPATYRVAVQTSGIQEGLASSVPPEATGPISRVAMLQQTTTTTYFPDTSDPSRAAAVTLNPGEERLDIDVHVATTHAGRQSILVTTALPRLVDRSEPIVDGATITGTVRDSAGRALSFASVTLDGNATQTSGVLDASALLATYRTGFTDERGTYEFSGLRSGRYVVRAAKAGYSTPRLSPTAPAEAAGMRELRAGERSVLDVTLVPWGVVSGHVRDDFADPVHGATVTLLQAQYQRGRRRLVPVPVSPRTTDDRGEFRIFAVPPGDYIVMARTAENADGLTGYAPTFYSGTTLGSEARHVTVGLGDEVNGVEFAMVPTQTFRVSGTTLDASGQPTTQLRLSLSSPIGMTATLRAQIDADGTCEFDDVPAGQYILRADEGRTNTFTEGAFVAMPLTVANADVKDLRVQAAVGSTVTGRFVFDRSVRTTDPPPTAVTITAVPDDFDASPEFIASTQANAVGVFQLRGITGTRRLQITRVPPRYMLSAILANGRDITDAPIAFGRANQSLDDVEVVLTDRVTSLTVRVTDGRRPAGAGVHVVMFSTDATKLYPLSRYQHHQTTGPDGTFTLTGLPAGSYFVVAVPTVPAGDEAWRDPAYLDSIIANATVITVGDGENAATITLRQ